MPKALTSPIPTPDHIILCRPKGPGNDEYVTVAYAVDRLGGYYDLTPEEIERGLLAGTQFQTFSFIYRLPA